MRRRPLSNPFTRSGIDQHGGNHTPTEQSYFPTGRGAAPENGAFVGQMNHMTRHHNSESRANVGTEVQPYVPVDPYSHSSTTETRSLTPVSHTHCTNYNAPIMRDVEADLSNRQTGNGGPLKRRRSGSFYSAGGSSSGSSHMPLEKPSVDFQSAPSYRSNLTINDEDSSRNVRRRYRLDLEPSVTRSHVPAHSQVYHSAPGQHANGGQWNCFSNYPASSQRRISPSDMSSGSRHEMNQVQVGGSSSDPFFSRHPASSSHGPTMREDHVNHSRRSESSYGNGSRYSHYAHGGTSTDGAHTHTPAHFSSRNYSRHSYAGGWRSSYRSGRPRLAAIDRFPPSTESHDRMGHHETILMVDQAPFYGNSRNFSDQYRDMRLDIDNMSYEDLLNLEESIGNVSTGLSEDNMSKYLMEKNHCFDENQEEVSCPICLEEYKNGDKIGRMGKCGHEYHVDCIKKWLLMKKLCPICKTECSG
ncbi:putative transcription factor C2H2 family [Helianthus annuus]|uniref:RING-type E3 ubiquitin transferase n=1 Tax=Helianthus annuus TaxID=4232 RepID=A0A251SLU6_HELAN|nr:E3 ubiquitin-protein ligase MBR1 isoform X1 [Helianthus annuus]XP_022006216.1 E3 ubiquitin-protein ligase MBR1 isoform X1 [Helianthus annuus]XP_022006217.1 E3 ubiquitin-protein ligase MBR1 isoform X1 [Helianthus annuus]XP_035839352.1 E3 ubiquitin-protein ligase MBR1 isoform X1 [Helianthus annuus]XP_035839353.1 E3 ubiquitin-protein ligase MBR1 isoform X1 [Helianthus annuus]XP_035839354.1 E3 ubiquitin-protein ligase MBR1 isoform X1 [Helianthus annuus]XP_035839355.1 E3 ubiquitin-protein ligas